MALRATALLTLALVIAAVCLAVGAWLGRSTRRPASDPGAAGALARDLAERAAERARFQSALESMSEAVLVVGPDHRITFANRAALAVLLSQGTPVGRRLFDAIRAPALEELLERARDEVATAEFDLPGTPPRRMLARVTPLHAGAGQVLVMHDVSEMRRLETVRRDFVANVSHELRTPVSVILASAETLLDGALQDPEHGPRFVQAIHTSAERLSRLIADLLDLSRIEAGRYVLDPRELSVPGVLGRAVEAVRDRAASKGQAIRVTVPDTLRVFADAEALDQVLMNLLDNAVKYTPHGGQITVAAREEPGEVRIEVADDGPGIEPRHQTRIFERFYRVDSGRSQEMGGTGLGLAIVKHLVDAMGGRVGMELVHPHGSRFWLTLPARAVA
jgi:two-component system phosphate regulon sensor histidine kinase PhoR